MERANGTFQDRLVSELRLADANTLDEANDVLRKFLPRFNVRFGMPATRAGSAYRVPDAGLNIAGVLCHKERLAKDNTVQYHGRTLQLVSIGVAMQGPGSKSRNVWMAAVDILGARFSDPRRRLPSQLLCRIRPVHPEGDYPRARGGLSGNARSRHQLWASIHRQRYGTRTPNSSVATENWSRTGMERARKLNGLGGQK